MNSILDELRCLDGEIFRSELTQRLYLLLKTQIQDLFYNLSQKDRTLTIERVLAWPNIVREEELAALKSKSAELDLLFAQVAMLYVKTSHKSSENRVVKIRNPRLEDLVRNFYHNVIQTPWGKSGELWSFDPIKFDFCLREQFRKAIMDSVQIIHEARVQKPVEIDDSASHFIGGGTVVSDDETLNREHDSDDSEYDRPNHDDSATIQGGKFDDGATVKRGVSFTRAESVYSSVSKTSGNSKYANAAKPKITPLENVQEAPLKITLEEEEE